MNAAKYGLDKVFFGGCFIRGKIVILILSGCANRSTQDMLLPFLLSLMLFASGAKVL